MAQKKKAAKGRSQSGHGKTRTLSKAEREHIEKMRSIDSRTRIGLAVLGIVGKAIGGATVVFTVWLTEIHGPGGAPWWTWVVMSVSGTSAAWLAYLYWQEKRRNGALIERFAPYVRTLEEMHDGARSSSQLTPQGETQEGDK